jgi:hypothetical protein
MRLEVGFDQRAWDQVVEAAVQNDPNWRDLLDVVEYEGNTIYEWGTDGGLDIDLSTTGRSIGEYRRLALIDDRIVWVRHTDAIQDVASAITGRRRTLADVPKLLQLGVLADELDLYSALLTMRIAPLSGNFERAFPEEIFLDQPEAVLIGDGQDRAGRFVSVVVLYASADLAEVNLEDFTQRIEQGPSATQVDGRIIDIGDPRKFEVDQEEDLLQARIWLSKDPLPPPLSIVRFGAEAN